MNSKTAWLNRPEFSQMEPEKKQIISQLILETEGKPISCAIPLLMTAKKRLHQSNLSFSQAESQLIFEIMTSHLSPDERNRLCSLLKNPCA